MNILDFTELYTTDFKLKKLFAMNQHWENGCVFSMMREARKTSALLLLKNCNIEYTVDGDSEIFEKGSILYLPQGSLYTSRFSSDKGSADTILIEFTIENDEPFSLSKEVVKVAECDAFFEGSFNQAVDIYNEPVFSPGHFKAVVYSILYEISKRHRSAELCAKEYKSILPAIKHIESHYAENTSVSELARMCHLSVTYFRKIFKRYASLSPSEYQTSLKIDVAKRLLKSNFYSVGEVAEKLGFDDAAYFTKVFKKSVGVTPSQYIK